MKQKFILEKEEMDTLRQGGSVFIKFADGKIELSAEVRGSGLYKRDSNSPTNKARVLSIIREAKQPIRVNQISLISGINKPRVYSHLTRLRKSGAVVNSDTGWRIVHETTAKLPPALIQKNGHAKVTTNGR